MRIHTLPGINKKIDKHRKDLAAQGLPAASPLQKKGDIPSDVRISQMERESLASPVRGGWWSRQTKTHGHEH